MTEQERLAIVKECIQIYSDNFLLNKSVFMSINPEVSLIVFNVWDGSTLSYTLQAYYSDSLSDLKGQELINLPEKLKQLLS